MKLTKLSGPRREPGRLRRLSPDDQRKWYGAAWDDLPTEIITRICYLFKATGCMDVYDSPAQFLDVAIQEMKRRQRQVADCQHLVQKMRDLIGDSNAQG